MILDSFLGRFGCMMERHPGLLNGRRETENRFCHPYNFVFAFSQSLLSLDPSYHYIFKN